MYFLDQLNNIYIYGRYSSTGRALDCGSNGYRFKSYYLPLILQKEFLDKKTIFFYEGYKWDFTIDLIHKIKINILNKNLNLLCLEYSYILNKLLIISRKTSNFTEKLNYFYFWYYIYYINSIYKKNLTDSLNMNLYEKYNIITINFKNKQFRLNIVSFKNKIINLTVGKVLVSLNILDKSKKKTNKGERLFIEYLSNYLNNTQNLYGSSKLAVLKIINGRSTSKLNNNILKILNFKFNISKLIYSFNISNNYSKLKKIRSIKKRLKKRIIKLENIFNL